MMLKCAQADCNIREHRFLHLMGTEIQWWRSTNKRLHVKQRTGKVIDLKCSPCVAVHLKEIEVETLDTQTNKKFKSTRHAYRSSEDLVSRGPGHQRTRSSRTSIWRPSTRAPFIRLIALLAESELRNWTMPQPRDRPFSIFISANFMSPQSPNLSTKFCQLKLKGRFLTKIVELSLLDFP